MPITGAALDFGETLLQYGSYLTELGSRVLETPTPHALLVGIKLDSEPITGKRVGLIGFCDGYPLTGDNCDCSWRNDCGKLIGKGFGFRPTMDHVGSSLHIDIVHISGGRGHLSSGLVAPDSRIAEHALNFMQDKKPILFDVEVISGELCGNKKVGLLLNKEKIKIQINNKTKIKDLWGAGIQMSCDFDNPKVLKMMILRKIHEFSFQDQKHRDCCALMIRANESMEDLKEHLDLEPRRGPQLGLLTLLRAGGARKPVVQNVTDDRMTSIQNDICMRDTTGSGDVLQPNVSLMQMIEITRQALEEATLNGDVTEEHKEAVRQLFMGSGTGNGSVPMLAEPVMGSDVTEEVSTSTRTTTTTAVPERQGETKSSGQGSGASGASGASGGNGASGATQPRQLNQSIMGSMYNMTSNSVSGGLTVVATDVAVEDETKENKEEEKTEGTEEIEETEESDESAESKESEDEEDKDSQDKHATAPSLVAIEEEEEPEEAAPFELTETEHDYYDMLWDEVTKGLPDGSDLPGKTFFTSILNTNEIYVCNIELCLSYSIDKH